jgi:hypothetical protein
MPIAYIRLHAGSSFISKAIMLQSWSDVSHVSVELFRVAYEAREGIGVRSYPIYQNDDLDIKYVYAIFLTYDEAYELKRFFESQLLKQYDYVQVLRFLIRKKESRSTQLKWFCSEFALYGFNHVNNRILGNLEPYKCRPGDFKLLNDKIAKDVSYEYLNVRPQALYPQGRAS